MARWPSTAMPWRVHSKGTTRPGRRCSTSCVSATPLSRWTSRASPRTLTRPHHHPCTTAPMHILWHSQARAVLSTRFVCRYGRMAEHSSGSPSCVLRAVRTCAADGSWVPRLLIVAPRPLKAGQVPRTMPLCMPSLFTSPDALSHALSVHLSRCPLACPLYSLSHALSIHCRMPSRFGDPSDGLPSPESLTRSYRSPCHSHLTSAGAPNSSFALPATHPSHSQLITVDYTNFSLCGRESHVHADWILQLRSTPPALRKVAPPADASIGTRLGIDPSKAPCHSPMHGPLQRLSARRVGRLNMQAHSSAFMPPSSPPLASAPSAAGRR